MIDGAGGDVGGLRSLIGSGKPGPFFVCAVPPTLILFAPSKSTSDVGCISLVARQAHNLKVVGSNPTPATTF